VSYSVLSGSAENAATVLHESVYRMLWQIFGSAALGYLVGLLLGYFGSRVHEHGELLILLIGSVLMTVGLSLALRLSTLVSCLTLGAVAANYSDYSRRVFAVQSRTDPPFYAIFFVIAGANLHISLLKTVGLLGVIYFIVRAIAKYSAARLASRYTRLPAVAKEALPYGMFAHAGLAIGMVLLLDRRLPELAPRVSTVVLACVLVYELVGPLTAKISLVRAGESQAELEPVAEA
jgi:NhaP-type Na+/H+ or K+/H+ antiporter